MRLTHSIRWRIQFWHGAILIAVLTGLGFAAYQYQKTSELRRVDGELRQRVALLIGSAPPPPGRPPQDRPPHEHPGERPPGPPNFRLPAKSAALFGPKSTDGSYYVLWGRFGEDWTRSVGAPVDVPKPEHPTPEESSSLERTRGVLREVFAFAPPGECFLVGRSIEKELVALRQYARWLAAIGGAVLVLGLGGGWWIASRALRPIDAITATAVRISGGRMDERINVADTDSELGQLATILNSTFERLETVFTQQAQFTADAAHELRTPVSVIISQTQLGLRGERSAAEYREMLDACLRAGRRMQTLTQSLLELARHDTSALALQREPCDLAAIAREATGVLCPAAEEHRLSLNLELAPASCRANPDGIAQILLNLVSNAIEHTPEGGRITVRTSADTTHVTVTVIDTGCGIAAEHLPRIFHRFYRADQSRNRRTGGAGLGLAICKAIAEAHGGTLDVLSTAGQGSTFTLRIPLE